MFGSATQSVVELILRGKDEASKVFGDVQQKIGGLAGVLGTGLKIGAGAAVAGFAAVSGAAIVLGPKLVGLGSDAEEMQSKFNVVFSEFGGAVTAALDEFGEAAGRSRYELREYASVLGDTLKPMGFTEEAAADLSVEMVKLATDLSSFNNMPMDEALQRLQSTLIGNHGNALAFGVIINENTLAAELAANGWDELTGSQLEQAKVQARINLLMRGTTDAQGDAIRTADSWANQTRALKATLKDLGTEMGLALLPAITPLLAQMGQIAKSAAPLVTAAFQALIPYVTSLAQWLGDAIPAAIKTIAGFWSGSLQPVLQSLSQWLGEAIPAAIQTVSGFWSGSLQPALQSLTGLLSSELGPGLQAIGRALGEAIPLAMSIASSFWHDYLKPSLTALWELTRDHLIPLLGDLFDWLGEKLPVAIAFAQNAWDNVLKPALVWAGDFMSETLIPLIGDVIVWLQNNLPPAITVAKDVFSGAWDAIKSAVDAAWKVIEPIFSAIKDFADWLGGIVFDFKFNFPSIPSWATPGSPIPLHTAWKNFGDYLRTTDFSPRVNMSRAAPLAGVVGGGGGTTYLTINVNDSATGQQVLQLIDELMSANIVTR